MDNKDLIHSIYAAIKVRFVGPLLHLFQTDEGKARKRNKPGAYKILQHQDLINNAANSNFNFDEFIAATIVRVPRADYLNVLMDKIPVQSNFNVAINDFGEFAVVECDENDDKWLAAQSKFEEFLPIPLKTAKIPMYHSTAVFNKPACLQANADANAKEANKSQSNGKENWDGTWINVSNMRIALLHYIKQTIQTKVHFDSENERIIIFQVNTRLKPKVDNCIQMLFNDPIITLVVIATQGSKSEIAYIIVQHGERLKLLMRKWSLKRLRANYVVLFW